MNVVRTAIADVCVLDPIIHADDRGDFVESWHERRYRELGITDLPFVQDNVVRSGAGVLRGLHYQIEQPQGKLVQAIDGEIFDVAVDLRRSSPTFGRWVGVPLSGARRQQVWVPPGCAHGYYVMSPSAIVAYKCTAYFAPEHERTLRWDDPDLAIAWPVRGAPHLSGKDAAGIPLASAPTYR